MTETGSPKAFRPSLPPGRTRDRDKDRASILVVLCFENGMQRATERERSNDAVGMLSSSLCSSLPPFARLLLPSSLLSALALQRWELLDPLPLLRYHAHAPAPTFAELPSQNHRPIALHPSQLAANGSVQCAPSYGQLQAEEHSKF